MKTAHGTQKLTTFLLYLTVALFVLLPFHAVLTVWLASIFGHYTLFRLWIEVIIAVMFGTVIYFVTRQNVELVDWRARWLWWLSVAYVLLHIFSGIIALGRHEVNVTAFADAIVLNLRPVVIFWLAVVIAQRNTWLRAHWQKLLLWPAAIVVAFGLIQHFVLPMDFLRHLGYGPKTILPYETVDQKLAYARVMSTLRGANPLGAYLVLVLAALTALIIHFKKPKIRLILVINLLATLIVLFFTYSRSAWLGAVISIGCVAWLAIREQKTRRIFLIAVIVYGVIAVISGLALRQNSRFSNTFLHTDKTSHSPISSNQNHISALKSGLHDIARSPFGSGPGTAGPASVHNSQGARIAENYYVQLGQEVGVLGLGIFILINIILGKLLWRPRDPLSCTLLASLLGITLINLVSHAWTDDTLAVLWWAIAGIAVASDIIKAPSKKYEKTKEKTAL